MNYKGRLKGVAHDLLANAEWHLLQATQWQQYIGELAVVLPFARKET